MKEIIEKICNMLSVPSNMSCIVGTQQHVKKIRKTILKFKLIKYHVQCVSGQASNQF